MPMSTNINTYADIEAVLTQALPHGRATYTLASEGKATHWIQRAYKYRQLLQRQEALGAVKGFQPPTPFDRLRLTRKGNAVELDFNPAPEGQLMLPSGEKREVEIAPQPSRKPPRKPLTKDKPLGLQVEDELEAQAAVLLALQGDPDAT